jgi:two-component system KDP operon response regulator KdpE
MKKILVIDDDVAVLQLLQIFLENESYQVFTAKSGREGLGIFDKWSPDLVILDLVMPLMDGFETYRRMRERGVKSVLIMSHRQDERSAVRALEMGADDYLRKPVDLEILRAKIDTLLRRRKHQPQRRLSIYENGELLIDLDARSVERGGESVKLTPTEFRLLSTLLRKVGQVVTHEELIREVWGTDKDISLGSLKLYIYYLRRKIEDHPKDPHYLLSEWGIGYRFREPDSGPAW